MNGTIVGTIAGTVAGTVAGMATLAFHAATLAVSRRNRLGRKPAVSIKASTASDDIVPEFGEGDTLFVDVDIWNNRKYPIRIRIRKISLNIGSNDTFNVETPDDWKQDFEADLLESGVFYCTKNDFDLAPESRLWLECTLTNGKARAGERPCAIEVIYADKLREKVLRGQVPRRSLGSRLGSTLRSRFAGVLARADELVAAIAVGSLSPFRGGAPLQHESPSRAQERRRSARLSARETPHRWARSDSRSRAQP